MSILPKPDIITEEYTYQSLLGRGGFGAVYKCKNSKGQLLAIKRITNEQASLEAKTMSCLNGPEFRKYFVQFYNFFESRNGVKCIVMEYCELGSLENARLR
uniref:Protein kinase domain-containing protein n=1 Tax=Meloidogyne incognita TaxID=6306 RepID=A0A914MBA4_MELIC